MKVKDRTSGDTLLEGRIHKGLYCLFIQMEIMKEEVFVLEKGSLALWHHRLGHLNSRAISILTKNNIIDVTRPIHDNICCESCV